MSGWLIKAATSILLSLGLLILLFYGSYSTGLHFPTIMISATQPIDLTQNEASMFWASMLAPSKLAYQIFGSPTASIKENVQDIYGSIPDQWTIAALGISFLVGLVVGLLTRELRSALVGSAIGVIVVTLIGVTLTMPRQGGPLYSVGLDLSTISSISYALITLQFVSGLLFALVAMLGGILTAKLFAVKPSAVAMKAPESVVVQAREIEKPVEEELKEKPVEVEQEFVEQVTLPQEEVSEKAVAETERVIAVETVESVESKEEIPMQVTKAEEVISKAAEEPVSIETTAEQPQTAEETARVEKVAEETTPIMEQVNVEEVTARLPPEGEQVSVEKVAEEIATTAEKAVAERGEKTLEERLQEIEDLLAKFEEVKVSEPEVIQPVVEPPTIEAEKVEEKVVEEPSTETHAEEARVEPVEELKPEPELKVEKPPEHGLAFEGQAAGGKPSEESKIEEAAVETIEEGPEGLEGPLQTRVPCPICGNRLRWDDMSMRYYCPKCGVSP